MTNKTDFDATNHFGDKHASVYDEKIRKVIRGYSEMHDLTFHKIVYWVSGQRMPCKFHQMHVKVAETK